MSPAVPIIIMITRKAAAADNTHAVLPNHFWTEDNTGLPIETILIRTPTTKATTIAV